MRYPIEVVKQYFQILRLAAQDATQQATAADAARLIYLENHAGPRRQGETRSDYETRVSWAKLTAPPSGWRDSKNAADCRARLDVVSTLQGGCFTGSADSRAAAAREMVQVLRLDPGGLAAQAAHAVEVWATSLTAPPAPGAVDQLRAWWGAR